MTAIEPCPEDPRNCSMATVRVTAASTGGTGQLVAVDIPKGTFAAVVKVGDRIMVAINTKVPASDRGRYQFVDHDRSRPLLLLAGLFAVAVIALSRWRGLAALGALVITALVLTQFVLPAILSGADPLLIAVVGGTLIMVLALFLTTASTPRPRSPWSAPSQRLP